MKESILNVTESLLFNPLCRCLDCEETLFEIWERMTFGGVGFHEAPLYQMHYRGLPFLVVWCKNGGG